MYTEESLDTLKQSIDIVEVLGEHLNLKRNGSTYKACCPFHTEKTPSFFVYPSTGSFYCFGCGVHGDTIHFLKEYLGYSFVDSVLLLAKRYNVQLEVQAQNKPSDREEKDILYQINVEAETFFRCCLYRLPEGRKAIQYLYQRGMSPDTLDRFHLGYAPEYRLFIKAMKEKHISEKQLQLAGFLSNQHFLFSRRIIFPIHDALGHTIGFSSRSFLKDSNQVGKYINTPETTIFKKSRVLFGLSFSRRRIAKERRVILVEGQIDCLQMIDAGFNCTVASQGTAFTESHVRELHKLGVTKAYILFDGDQAGRKASLRVGDLCQRAGITALVCPLAQGQDPDSLLLQKDPDYLSALLDKSEEFLSFLVSEHLSKHPNLSPKEKSSLIKELVSLISHWGDQLVIHGYLERLASIMKVPQKLVHSLYTQKDAPAIEKPKTQTRFFVNKDLVLETDVLRCLLLSKPHNRNLFLTAKAYLTKEDFLIPECRSFFTYLMQAFDQTDQPPALEDTLIHIHQYSESLVHTLLKRNCNQEQLESICVQAIQQLVDRKTAKECQQLLLSSQSTLPQQDELTFLHDYLRLSEKKVIVQLV